MSDGGYTVDEFSKDPLENSERFPRPQREEAVIDSVKNKTPIGHLIHDKDD